MRDFWLGRDGGVEIFKMLIRKVEARRVKKDNVKVRYRVYSELCTLRSLNQITVTIVHMPYAAIK